MNKRIFILCLLLLPACAGVQGRYHRVEKGETLSSIADAYDVKVSDLKESNGRAVGGLKAGTKIYIPYEERADWNRPEGRKGVAIARKPAHVKSQPLAFEMSQARFSWPVQGAVSSAFGERDGRPHEGIDIRARSGTPVVAARSGKVIYATNKISGYGNMIIIRHSDAFASVYAHLSRMNVKRGAFVERGKLIGKVGMTGHATGPHLHFEIRNRRVPVDPLQYLTGQIASSR